MRQSRFFIAAVLAAVLIPYLAVLGRTGRAEGAAAGRRERDSGSGFLVILDRGDREISMDLEQYLIGVTAAQISPDYEMEAIKAQAILARTAVKRQMGGENVIPESALDMDTLEQGNGTFSPDSKWTADAYGRVKTAVEETKAKTVLWEGDYILPLFHLRSAGRTRMGEEHCPYLNSVPSPESENQDVKKEFYFSEKEFAARLNRMTETPKVTEENVLKSIQIVEMDGSGYINEILVGERIYDGDAVRWALDLPSSAYSFEAAEGGVKCTVRGEGHGYGLEQYGANALAREGWTAEKILNYYYKNIVIATE